MTSTSIEFPPATAFSDLIRLARLEDLGPDLDDVTSRLSIEADRQGVATLVQKQAGVVAGLPIVAHVCAAYDAALQVKPIIGVSLSDIEGTGRGAGVTPLLTITGPLRSILSAERVLLNFVQHLSGVATMTRQFVDECRGTRAQICDTRKTLPGYRLLDKYAVRCGGGMNHRIGLYDMVLVKDNHLAARKLDEIAGFTADLVRRAHAAGAKLEMEVDNPAQLAEVLKTPGVDYILLDNMSCDMMREAVTLRDAAGRRETELEASGGVNLQTVRDIALTGVDRISVGAITHSAPALDVGLDI